MFGMYMLNKFIMSRYGYDWHKLQKVIDCRQINHQFLFIELFIYFAIRNYKTFFRLNKLNHLNDGSFSF